MILIFIVLLGVLLQSSVAPAKDYHVDFNKFCDLYGELLKIPKNSNDRNGPTLYDSLYNIQKEIIRIDRDLVSKQGLPGNYYLENHCVQHQNYLKAECLFYKRKIIAYTNADWNFFLLNFGPYRQLLRPYVGIWLLHPQMKGCAQRLNRPQDQNFAKVTILRGLQGEKAGDYAMLFKKQHGKSTLRKETEQSCGRDNEEQIFCPGLLEMIRLADLYQQIKDEDKNERKWDAYQLQIDMIKRSHPQFNSFSLSDQSINDRIVSFMEEFLIHSRSRQKAEIIGLLALMPEKPRRIKCEDFSKIETSNKKIDCIFWKAMNLIRTFVESTATMKHGNGAVMLNTNIDYKSFLELTQMSHILSAVQNQNYELTKLVQWITREVRKDVNNRFKGLRAYFKDVADFNQQKADADIQFIKGRLDKYKEDVDKLQEELSKKLGKIIEIAFDAVHAEIGENTVRLAIESAVFANPLSTIFGSGDVGSFVDHFAKLATSWTNIVQLRRASQTFDTIRYRTKDIAEKFEENNKFLTNLNTLIEGVDKKRPNLTEFANERKFFLESYANYDPKVKRPDLTAIGTTYGNLVDECCDVIMSQEPAVASGIKMNVKSSGLCPKTKVVAEEMFETFAEIYDFQFDMIEAMAAYMRAANAHNAATGIAEDYDKLGKGQKQDTLIELKTMSIFSFISYQINIWDISDSYCHILTYKEGGHTPSVCQHREINVARLAAYRSPTCRNTEVYRDVPINGSDQGFINLSSLYAGRNVTFKIPSSQWLIDNDWISARDKNSAIVIKKFEVFLPTVSSRPRHVEVYAKDAGDNKISVASNIHYVIFPHTELISEYYEGNGSVKRCIQASQVFNNPYGAKLPKLCRMGVEDCQVRTRTLFPSVYSRWKITVYNYSSTPVPTPENADFKLKVGVKLCILRPRSNDLGIDTKKVDNQAKKINSKFRDQERPSCPKPQYWSKNASRCIDCPEGSKPALDGYFCSKIPKNTG